MERTFISRSGRLSISLNLIGVSYDYFKASIKYTYREVTSNMLGAEIELTPISCGIYIERTMGVQNKSCPFTCPGYSVSCI